MVIHFLQYAVTPAILPCLHDVCSEKFNSLHDITTIDMVEQCDIYWKSENRQPLGELFLRFLDYYSNFEWVERMFLIDIGKKMIFFSQTKSYTKNAISIRTGGVLPIEECRNARSPKNDPNHWLTLCIEEPFDLTNTAVLVTRCTTRISSQKFTKFSFNRGWDWRRRAPSILFSKSPCSVAI